MKQLPTLLYAKFDIDDLYRFWNNDETLFVCPNPEKESMEFLVFNRYKDRGQLEGLGN